MTGFETKCSKIATVMYGCLKFDGSKLDFYEQFISENGHFEELKKLKEEITDSAQRMIFTQLLLLFKEIIEKRKIEIFDIT